MKTERDFFLEGMLAGIVSIFSDILKDLDVSVNQVTVYPTKYGYVQLVADNGVFFDKTFYSPHILEYFETNGLTEYVLN